MSENNNRNYSTGGNDAFDLFSAFESAPVEKTETKSETAAPKAGMVFSGAALLKPRCAQRRG